MYVVFSADLKLVVNSWEREGLIIEPMRLTRVDTYSFPQFHTFVNTYFKALKAGRDPAVLDEIMETGIERFKAGRNTVQVVIGGQRV